jgi:tetratricopeptide (TPR) repeat protein
MLMRTRMTCVILKSALVLSAFLFAAVTWSKPPDLPLDIRETCAPPCSAPVTPDFGMPADGQTGSTSQTRQVNVTWDVVVPAQAQREAAREEWFTAEEKEDQAHTNSNYRQYAANRFYEIAKQCEAKGDLAMARNCYEEATRMCPDCEAAKRASQRLVALANSWQGTEAGVEAEEEPPAKNEINPARRDEARRMVQAQQMYQLGQRYQRVGDLDNAYRCYRDAHAYCPDCRCAQDALNRMRQIDATKSGNLPASGEGMEEQEPPVGRRPGWSPDRLDQGDQAEMLFHLGERCRLRGDLRTACMLYQEAHLFSPESQYGMMAIDRMHEIEHQDQPAGRDGRQGVNDVNKQPKPRRLQTLLWYEEEE